MAARMMKSMEGARAGGRTSWCAAAALGVLAACATAPASAQEAKPANDYVGLEELIVTATKRPESLATVPLAITAVSGEVIEKQRVQTIQDVFLRVPSTSFNELRGLGGNFPSIRGSFSTDDSAGADLSTAMFIDGVYYGTTMSFNPDFFDVGKVEVLRGPQGTAFGRNVVGGAILIESNAPSFEQSAQVTGTIGNIGIGEIQGYLNGPITDKVAGRVAFSYKKSDGVAQNLTTGNTVEGADLGSVRASVLFQPNEDLSVRIVGSATRDRQDGSAWHLVYNLTPVLPAGTPLPPKDPDYVSQEIDGINKRDLNSLSAEVNWNTPLGTVTSVTGYHTTDSYVLTDSDSTAARIWVGTIDQEEKLFSQELRIASDASKGRWFDYLLGVYYMDADTLRDKTFDINPTAGTRVAVLTGPFVAHTIQDINTKTTAIFGEVIVHPLKTIDVRLGGRYTDETKDGYTKHTGQTNPFTGGVYNTPVSADFSQFTPKVTAEWHPNDLTVVYVSYAKGYKSGGFNSDLTSAAAAVIPFSPEKNVTWEAGARSRFFDNRLSAGVTLYDSVTEDLQVRLSRPPLIIFANAGRARTKGAELELYARPIAGLDIGLTASYMDAVFEDFVISSTQNYTGKRVPWAPKNAVTLFGQYKFHLGDSGSLTVRGEYMKKSKIYFDTANTPDFTEQSAIESLNLRATWDAPDDRFSVSLWGNNVTDERPITSLIPLNSSVFYYPSTTGAIQTARYGRPRTFGLTATWRFQ